LAALGHPFVGSAGDTRGQDQGDGADLVQ
jgi:hypothetical protein